MEKLCRDNDIISSWGRPCGKDLENHWPYFFLGKTLRMSFTSSIIEGKPQERQWRHLIGEDLKSVIDTITPCGKDRERQWRRHLLRKFLGCHLRHHFLWKPRKRHCLRHFLWYSLGNSVTLGVSSKTFTI